MKISSSPLSTQDECIGTEPISLNHPGIIGLLAEFALEENVTIHSSRLCEQLAKAQCFLRAHGRFENSKLVALSFSCRSLYLDEAKGLLPSVDLLDLVVSPSHRRQGHGKALFQHLQNLSESKGRKILKWGVSAPNFIAHSFYKSFVPVKPEGGKSYIFPSWLESNREQKNIKQKEEILDCGVKLYLSDDVKEQTEVILYSSFDASLPGTVVEIVDVKGSNEFANHLSEDSLWHEVLMFSKAKWDARYVTWYDQSIPDSLRPREARFIENADHYSSRND